MKIRNWLIGLLALGFVFGIASSSWGVPRMINVQGRITGFSPGNTIDFDIYDAETAGTLVWNGVARVIVTGAIGGADEIAVDSNGIFNVILGTIPDSVPMPEFTEDDYYLQITVAGTPLVPRQRLVATPFAITSRNVRGGTVVASSSETKGIAVSGDATGSKGIGVLGTASGDDSVAVYGENAANVDANNPGVMGFSTRGYSIYGYKQNDSDNDDKAAIFGRNVEANPGDNPGVRGESVVGIGVYGQSEASNRPAIRGENTSSGSGIYATSVTGFGVRGESSGTGLNSGVVGVNLSDAADAGPGVSGLSRTAGVAGASSKVGVAGFGADNIGALAGLERVGVYGHGQILGVLGTSGLNFGVAGAGQKIGLVGYGGVASLGVPIMDKVGVYGSGVNYGVVGVTNVEATDAAGVYAGNTNELAGVALQIAGAVNASSRRIDINVLTPGAPPGGFAVFQNEPAGVVNLNVAGANYISVSSYALINENAAVLITPQSAATPTDIYVDVRPGGFNVRRSGGADLPNGTSFSFLIIN